MPKTPFKDLLPPLGEEELSALAASVRAEGVRDPVLLDEDDNVLDGHHRLGINPDALTHVIPGSAAWSQARRKAFVFQANFARRNLSDEQKEEVDEGRKEVARELYAETNGDGRTGLYTQAEIGRILGAAQPTVAGWIADMTDGGNASTGTVIGADNGSCGSVNESGNGDEPPAPRPRKARNVKLDPEDRLDVYDRWHGGQSQRSIAADYKISERRVREVCAQEKARRDEESRDRRTHTPELPKNVYRCIVMDPPWPMAKSERAPRPAQGRRLGYATMTVEEIGALDVPGMADRRGCHLYLWVTHRFLPDGLRLLEKWGFTYHCLLTWVKPTGMTPYSWMFNTEHVLFGYRGKFTAGRKGLKVAFEAPAPRGKHSTKPDVFFERVREFSVGPRLEMFARREHDGFGKWGNEFQD